MGMRGRCSVDGMGMDSGELVDLSDSGESDNLGSVGCDGGIAPGAGIPGLLRLIFLRAEVDVHWHLKS